MKISPKIELMHEFVAKTLDGIEHDAKSLFNHELVSLMRCEGRSYMEQCQFLEVQNLIQKEILRRFYRREDQDNEYE